MATCYSRSDFERTPLFIAEIYADHCIPGEVQVLFPPPQCDASSLGLTEHVTSHWAAPGRRTERSQLRYSQGMSSGTAPRQR